MPLSDMHISEADVQQAKYEIFSHVVPLVQRRMLCLVLKFYGLPHSLIAQIIGCSRNTVGNYLRMYRGSQGFSSLYVVNYRGQSSALESHNSSVEAMFRQSPPQTVKEAAARIEALTGIRRSLGRVRMYLKRLGMSLRKTGQIPAKADVGAQREFHDQTLQRLLTLARAGKCHVFFMDSAHFALSAFVGMLWCFERVFIKGASGRHRVNVIGAIHATTHDLTAFYNTTYINAHVVVVLLRKIAQDYAGKPIHIILDNARYQHCTYVKQVAEKLKINLVFLPPYSPNLNLIERLWKLIKAEVCATKYYDSAQKFEKALLESLAKINSKSYKNIVKARLTHNFQLFDHAQKLAA